MVAVSSARQHYYPAALIGQFSANSTKRARDRPVWVARRGVERVYRSTGDACGWRSGDPQLYDSADGTSSLEQLWSKAEPRLTDVLKTAELASEIGAIPASVFVLTLVPFIAHLMVRHPEIHLGQWSVLDTRSADHERAIAERRAVFWVAADTLTYQRRWLLLTTTEDDPFVSSDLGWQWIPGATPGEVFVPVSRTRAFVIRGGTPSYFYGDQAVAIDRCQATAADIASRRDALTFTAPTEIYAPDEQTAIRGQDLWEGRREILLSDGSPIDGQILPRTSAALTGLVIAGGHDPREAGERFLASNHQYGCGCTGRRWNRRARREHEQRISRRARKMERRPLDIPNLADAILQELPTEPADSADSSVPAAEW